MITKMTAMKTNIKILMMTTKQIKIINNYYDNNQHDHNEADPSQYADLVAVTVDDIDAVSF